MKSGIKANKLSFLLHYQYVETEEANHHISEVRTTLEALITNLSHEYEKMNNMADFLKLQIDTEEENDMKLLAELPESEQEPVLERQRKRKAQRGMIDKDHQLRVERISEDATNVWITLMQAIRRAEGIKAARPIFAKSRKAKPISYQIWVASGIYLEFLVLI